MAHRNDDQAGLFDAVYEADAAAAEVGADRQPAPRGVAGPANPAAARAPSAAELERMRAVLEESGDYKVLRRFGGRRDFHDSAWEPVERTFKAIYLDVETTGLESDDSIIELGLLMFEYDELGRVHRVLAEFDEFEDPGRPLPEEIVSLTGITDAEVRGRRITDERVAELAAAADLVIAHNAGFDRPLVEKRFPVFEGLPWACSVTDVDWTKAGIRNRKLEYLAMMRGFFYDSHRAINDCFAGLELLAGELAPGGDDTALADLLANARLEGVRLWAEGSPFESKDLLKGRKYRWNPAAKLWWRDLGLQEHDGELEWLASSVYPQRRALPYCRIDATVRYSSRLPAAPPRGALRK